MNHAGDSVVLVNSEFVPIIEGIASKLETVKHYVLMTDTGEMPESSLHFAGEYEALLSKAPATFKFPVLDENTEATTFYTTGTTGLPKGVHFTHRQLMLHTLVQCATMGAITSPGRVHSDDVYMPITPMFHVHAWGVPFTATMLGLKQVYPGKYEPAMLLNLIVKERVTVSHCVPTIIHMLVNSPIAGAVDLSYWKVVIGGSALPKGLAMAARKLGIEIYAGYGMSETCPLISIGNLKEPMLTWPEEQKIDVAIKAGFPVAFAEAKVVDPAGNDLPLDGVSQGELVLRAPWLTRDYFRDPERSKELWINGWMHTGDVAYIDSEGYINITDRIKDVIKSGGEWVSSLEMEDMLSQFDGVSESAVIGVPDVKWGERPAAFIVLKPEYVGKVTAEAIRQYLLKQSEAGRLSKWAVPERIEFLESLPKTSVGKIAKRELRAQFA
jgi:fatty-acyl-CoA synthase